VLLLELNTRCWIESVRATHGDAITLASVPDAVAAEWAALGFTHVWAMGVWTTGALCRKHALTYWKPGAQKQHPHLALDEHNVVGSPYAISAYRVPARLGGDDGLAKFRQQLHRHRLKLILDFVPNHVAIDHPWLIEQPDLFVQSATQRPETFRFSLPDEFTEQGARLSAFARSHAEHEKQTPWFAHGRDPFFPAWSDTAQLDYRCAATHEAMLELLLEISSRCDGVRCDMAMLALHEVFEKTWHDWPVADEQSRGPGDFWPNAISSVKRRHPNFTFIAEVYWDLEPRLQDLGFHFTYAKTFLDRIERREFSQLIGDLAAKPRAYLQHCLWFLENHDEARIASRLTVAEHKAAAALLLLGLPGLPLIYEGQMEGWTEFAPVQLGAWPSQRYDKVLGAWHERLLLVRQNCQLKTAHWEIHREENPRVLNVGWKAEAKERLLLINFSPETSVATLSPNRNQVSARDEITGVMLELQCDGAKPTIELQPWQAMFVSLAKA
jgi:hypothetical protein